MGKLNRLKEIESPLEITRMLELVSANPEIGSPAMKFKIALCELDEIADIEEKYPKRLDKTAEGREQLTAFRAAVGAKITRGWEGVTAHNIGCISRRFMRNDGFGQLAEGESEDEQIDFDDENCAILWDWMDPGTAFGIQSMAISTQAFAEERARNKKK